MIRRSLRIGIRLGLLSGLAFVLFKIVQARRTAPDLSGSDDGWPQAPSPPSGGPVARSVDVETAVAPGPAEPFAMVPTVGEAGDAPEAPPAPVEEAPAPVEPVSPREAAPPVKERPVKERPAKASPAKAVGPSPAAEAAARAAAESAAKKAVAKSVATKKGAAKKGAAKKGAARKAVAKAGAAKSGVAKATAKATAKAAAKVVGPAKKARAVPTPAEPAPGTAWVPAQEGACPSSHPIKARLASRIFHLPGMAAYQRTAADRCYADEASAEADGLRKAKR